MELRRTQFLVIEGGGAGSTAIFDLPSVVLARSHQNRDALIGYRLATSEARRALEYNRRQPVYDLWSCIIGTAPPQAGATAQLADGTLAELSGISSAYACFQGLRRPVGDDDHGRDYLAYVHKPKYRFRFVPSMARCVQPRVVPEGFVFVTYVKLDYPNGRPYGRMATRKKAPVHGIITHWDFVEAAYDESGLPIDYETRFRQRQW